MTDWRLLVVQFIGVLIGCIWCQRSAYRRGRKEGYSAGYAIGRLDGRALLEGK